MAAATSVLQMVCMGEGAGGGEACSDVAVAGSCGPEAFGDWRSQLMQLISSWRWLAAVMRRARMHQALLQTMCRPRG